MSFISFWFAFRLNNSNHNERCMVQFRSFNTQKMIYGYTWPKDQIKTYYHTPFDRSNSSPARLCVACAAKLHGQELSVVCIIANITFVETVHCCQKIKRIVIPISDVHDNVFYGLRTIRHLQAVLRFQIWCFEGAHYPQLANRWPVKGLVMFIER